MNTEAYEAYVSSVHTIAKDKFNQQVIRSDNGHEFAFMTKYGLCLMGIREWYEDEGYFDISWRMFLGKIPKEVDWLRILTLNHFEPDTPYGILNINNEYILTNFDRYRFLFEWGKRKIFRLILIRFGSTFDHFELPQYLFKVTPMSTEFYVEALNKYGSRELLVIPEDFKMNPND